MPPSLRYAARMLDESAAWLSGLRDALPAPSAAAVAGLSVAGVALLALTIVVAPWLIARLPADHFSNTRPRRQRHPAARVALMVLANSLALIALLLGLLMLVTPGPGIVMLVIALSLADFPGRHTLIRRLVTTPSVFTSLNWIRRRRGCKPFVHPDAAPARLDGHASSHAWPCLLLVMSLLQVAPSAEAAEPTSSDGTPVPQAPSPDSVEQNLRDTAEQLERLDAALLESRAERDALAARLASVDARASERRERVTGLDGEIEHYAASLQRLDAELDTARGSLEQRHAQLAESLRRIARLDEAGPLAVLLRHEDPALADRVSVWAGYALRAQRATIERQLRELSRIETAQARALKDHNWLEYIRRKAAGQRDAQIDASNTTRGAVAQVDARITETTRSVATLREDTSRLQTLLEELRAQEASRSGYFESGRGDWPMPVSGRIDARFGDVKSVGKLVWNGLFIRAENGRSVKVIADGEVVYSDWLTGFGLLVIVDHGDGWMSLYGGNRDVVAPVGAWVESGATIATVGDSGGQNSSGLYFEIRKDARPVDPESWISGIG